MVPPRLPPGDYELTLRSRQPEASRQHPNRARRSCASRGGVRLQRGPIERRGAVQCSGNGGGKRFRAGSYRWVFPACFSNCNAAGHCHFTAAAHDCSPPVRRKLSIRRGRAQDGNHGRIPWRQPLAHEPCRLRYGFAVRGRLQSELGPNPKSKSHLSRPDLCPSYERALKSGDNSSACMRGCAPFARARPSRLAIVTRRRRGLGRGAQRKRGPLSIDHRALAEATLSMP